MTSIPAVAEDALTVLDTAEVEAAHIYGVSMGGFVAQHLAITAPRRLRSLVLGCSAVPTAEKPRSGRAGYVQYWLPPRLSTPLSRRYFIGHNYLVDATRQADDAVLSFLRDPWRAASTGNTR
ncbi:hypothetical protein QR77_39000 [Streptomyces sp. 150FB]|nr:hypothetical protein QR77_39000 [Streptomyces sp. 150FB]